MALDFPTSPSVNDTVTIDNKTWRYNGKGWKLIPNQIQGIQGTQGTQGLQGVQGPLSNFQGTQGTQGTQGLQGLQGTQGLQGSQGTQGFSPVGLTSSSNTTLVSSDAGKLTIIDANVTINTTTGFSIGEMCTIYNVGIATRIITQGASTTLRWAGTTTTGNRSLSPKGLGTIVCVDSNDYVISGAGLT